MRRIHSFFYIIITVSHIIKGAHKDTPVPTFQTQKDTLCPIIKKPCLLCIKNQALLVRLKKENLSSSDKKALLDQCLELQKPCPLCFKKPLELPT